MKIVERLIVLIVVIMLAAVAHVPLTEAETGFSTMSSADFQIVNGGMSSLGGTVSSADNTLMASNMYPYQQGMTISDYMPYFDKAANDLDSSKTSRDSLLLISVTPSEAGIGRLIKYPKENYETDPGFLDRLATTEASLINARDIFAYGVYLGIPGAQEQLRDSIKTLATIYLMIGDEFLIDALEFRFSSDTLGLNQKLDEQICLLGNGKSNPTECVIANATPHGAQYYYEKAVQSFVYGFQPSSIGQDLYISDYFDDAVLSLFNLSSERLSAALREKSSKQFVRLMSPDPNQEWLAARKVAVQTIKDSSTGTYLVAAVAADNALKKNVDFAVNGGDALISTLTTLRKQGSIINNSNLNHLGYDKRHVPMYEFETLEPLVQADINTAITAQSDFDKATRDMDSDNNAMRQEMNLLIGSYTTNLFLLTGCSAPIPDDAVSVENFRTCVVLAGGDLLDCDVNNYESCMSTKITTQAISAKYRNIMNAQLRLNQARLNRQNILEQIKLETELHKNLISIKSNYVNSTLVSLEYYYDLLKNACTESDSSQETVVKNKINGQWVKVPKQKIHTTTELCTIKDDNLRINTNKESEMLKATTEYEIKVADQQLADKIKNILLNEAEAKIEVQIAAQQKNSAVADFDDAIQQKEYYWTLFQRSLTQTQNYFNSRIPTERVLKSQAAISFSTALNRAAHSAYLATKALEYKYVSPIENKNLPGGKISVSDLFKAQTPAELQKFLNGLHSLNVLECPFGSASSQGNVISIVYDILGVSRTATTTEKKKAMNDFLSLHVVPGGREFTFTLSSFNTFLPNPGMRNMKIWGGAPPTTCGDLVNPVKGVTVIVQTDQLTESYPLYKLSLSGHSTLTDALGNIVEYIPAYSYQFMLDATTDNPTITAEEQYAYVNANPYFPASGLGGWTNKFKSRGMSSSGWTLKLRDPSNMLDYTQIKDILIHIDTISQ